MIKNKIFKNASWIICAKIVQSVLGLIISMFTARYLGPSNFGIINYAQAIVAFATPIMQLGINGIIVQELVSKPDSQGETIGTALCANIVSALLSILGIFVTLNILNSGEKITILVGILYSISLIAQAFEIIIYWFQAKLLSKYTSIGSLVAYLITSIYRIFLLITGKSVAWFALSYTLDYSIIAAVGFWLYFKFDNQKLSFSIKRLREMIDKSKYYILSGLMISIFAQTDRFMIKNMMDNTDVGIYSAAVVCAGLGNFVFVAIIDSFRPIIFESKEKSTELFEKNLCRLYSVVIYLSLIICIGIAIFAKIIIYLLYGIDYINAVSTLKILVWYTTFSYFGAIRNIWLLAVNKQKLIWKIDVTGACFNVLLNLFLIPLLGINGAALASLITQLFINFILGFIIKDVRRNNELIIKSLNFKFIKDILKSSR